jgi:ubiquinone/menaquinone biosynthesis C-methylase UbiE
LLQIEPGKKQTILDIGCDWDYAPMLIKSRFPEIICKGIDIDEFSCNYGNIIAQKNNLDINLYYANAKQLPFEDKVFDCFFSIETFEHILPEWREKVFKEIHRVLKPNGRGVILYPNPKGISQLLKNFLSKTPISKFSKFLPNIKDGRKQYIKVPISTNEEDVFTITCEIQKDQFIQDLEKNGFQVKDKGAFIFMVEIIPNWLLGPSIKLEKMLENCPFTKNYSTTLYFKVFSAP